MRSRFGALHGVPPITSVPRSLPVRHVMVVCNTSSDFTPLHLPTLSIHFNFSDKPIHALPIIQRYFLLFLLSNDSTITSSLAAYRRPRPLHQRAVLPSSSLQRLLLRLRRPLPLRSPNLSFLRGDQAIISGSCCRSRSGLPHSRALPSPTEEPSLLCDVSVEFRSGLQQPWHLLSSRSSTPSSIRQPCHLQSPALFFKSLLIVSIKTENPLLYFPFCFPSFVLLRSAHNIATHYQQRTSAAHLPTNELKSSSSVGLLTFTKMPDMINSCQAITRVAVVFTEEEKHSSSPSSTVLSPQPRATLLDLLEGAISCFLPRHRSTSSLDTDMLEEAVSCFLPQHRSAITLRHGLIARLHYVRSCVSASRARRTVAYPVASPSSAVPRGTAIL
ncbi:hypothetical protein BHE74_00039646 [Ensete ventricosum]|nr:hypothetical protein BHE74_00039646 [Ensete ventricosum]RZS08748.1 hypothetical protein BHM03_00039771 [Ensete ventricosum]